MGPGPLCDECQVHDRAQRGAADGGSGLWRVARLGLYEGALAGWVRDLKYENRPQLARPLGALLAWAIGGTLGPPVASRRAWNPIIVPVPMHAARLRARGYNQASLLAMAMGEALGLPVHDGLLIRRDAGPPQAGLARTERLRLLSGAFAPGDAGGHVLAGADVLLVDDVLTTGATLEACAACLMPAGAGRVLGCVVAVGVQRRLWA